MMTASAGGPLRVATATEAEAAAGVGSAARTGARMGALREALTGARSRTTGAGFCSSSSSSSSWGIGIRGQ
jgi:hypothetical protein